MQRLVTRAAVPAVLASVLVSACGGGGGGGSSPGDGITTPAPPSPPPASTPPPPPPAPPPGSTATPPPSATSAEYRNNWGLGAVHADAAFNAGASGKGITVAVIDTGVDPDQPDLVGRVSPKSTDIDPGRNDPAGIHGHGTDVSGVIAANHNGWGTVGVAYQATILGIRADNATGPECPKDGCQFSSTALAKAIDYAVANGAQVINMSLGGETPDGPAFEAALARAKAAGVVVAASAGNDGEAHPGWPARYAVDPRFAGYVIAVGASAEGGAMADFSNKAGVAAHGYIVAPGERVVTDCERTSGGTSCWYVSGTSFSAPQVAGAIALLLEAFPNISGADAIDILLRSASDQGVTGTDAVWGRGMMDLASAFSPIGALHTPTPGGAVEIGDGQTAGTATGLALGDALSGATGLKTIGHDEYQRLFKVDLASRFHATPGGLVGATPATRATATALPLGETATLSLQAESPLYPDEHLSEPMLDFVRGEAPQSVFAAAELGRFSFSAWSGKGGVSRPQADGARDAFRLLASPQHTVAVGYRAGDWRFSAEQGGAERREFMSLHETEGPAYVSATAAWSKGDLGAAFTAGSLEEPQGPLGSDIRAASPLAMPARTDFAAVGVERKLAGLTLRGEASFGRTSVEQGLLGLDEALSSQWRLAAFGGCAWAWAACSRFALELEQPLRLEEGAFTAVLADVPAGYFDPVAFSTRRIDASPSGRQINLRAAWERDLEDLGSLRLRAVTAVDSGHRASRGVDVGAAVDWRFRF